MKKTLIFIAIASSLVVGCSAGSSSLPSAQVPQTLTLKVPNPTCDLSNMDSTVTMTVSGLQNGSLYAYGDLISNTSTYFGYSYIGDGYSATSSTMINDVLCTDIAAQKDGNLVPPTAGVYPVTAAQVLLPTGAAGVSNTINITVTGSLPLATTAEKLVAHKLSNAPANN